MQISASSTLLLPLRSSVAPLVAPRPVEREMMMFSPLVEAPSYAITSNAQVVLNAIWLCSITTTTAILFWDWACELSRERRLIWNANNGTALSSNIVTAKGPWYHPGRRWISASFLLSRWIALAQCLFFLIIFAVAKDSSRACEAMRAVPFTFSVVNLAAHIVMCLRVYGLSGQDSRVGLFFATLTAIGTFSVRSKLISQTDGVNE